MAETSDRVVTIDENLKAHPAIEITKEISSGSNKVSFRVSVPNEPQIQELEGGQVVESPVDVALNMLSVLEANEAERCKHVAAWVDESGCIAPRKRVKLLEEALHKCVLAIAGGASVNSEQQEAFKHANEVLG